MTEKKPVDQYKILVVGNTNVGKSCLICAFSDNNPLHSNSVSTIGIDFKMKTIELNGKTVKLQIWASAGEQRLFSFQSAKEFYKGAKGIIILYDITDVRSFGFIPKWLESIKEYGDEDVQLILVGNKCDLEQNRVVPRDFGHELAKEKGLRFYETSALTKMNVEKVFHDLAVSIHGNSSQSALIKDNPDVTESSSTFSCPCI